MTGTEKLRKENQALRKEIQDVKNQLKKITDDMSQAWQQTGPEKTREMSPDKEHSVEFVCRISLTTLHLLNLLPLIKFIS